MVAASEHEQTPHRVGRSIRGERTTRRDRLGTFDSSEGVRGTESDAQRATRRAVGATPANQTISIAEKALLRASRSLAQPTSSIWVLDCLFELPHKRLVTAIDMLLDHRDLVL